MSKLSGPANTSLQQAARLFEEAFSSYGQKLLRHALRKVNHPELAEDLVQETFVVAWKNREILFRTAELELYLHGVLRHKILDLFRKDRVRLKHALEMTNSPPHTTAPADERLLTGELEEIIQRELEGMPNRMLEIYRLRKEGRMTVKEICGHLGLSEQTVKNQLYRATERLRKRLLEYDANLLSAGLIVFGVGGIFHHLGK